MGGLLDGVALEVDQDQGRALVERQLGQGTQQGGAALVGDGLVGRVDEGGGGRPGAALGDARGPARRASLVQVVG